MIQRGRIYEDFAAKILVEKGYQVLVRNYRKPIGEVDLILLREDLVVFLEVKARKNWDFGYPAEFMSTGQKRRYRKMASFFLSEFPYYRNYNLRFDIFELYLDAKKYRHIESAFEL